MLGEKLYLFWVLYGHFPLQGDGRPASSIFIHTCLFSSAESALNCKFHTEEYGAAGLHWRKNL